MVNYVTIQQKIDHGRQIGAQKVGQPYSVYRLGPNSNGNFLDPGNLVASNVPVMRRSVPDTKSLETAVRQGTHWYELIGSFSPFLVGDVFVQTDPVYGPGATSVDFQTDQINAFCLASHAPIKKSIGGRIDRTVTIYRPQVGPTADARGPFFMETLDQAEPLRILNGQCIIDAPGAKPAQIPAGFMIYYRPYGHDQFAPQTKGMTKPTLWFVYIPPLPGFIFREGDRIVEPTGERYVVYNPYRQDTGQAGFQLVVEREIGAG
jgi:hypothetical protein